MSWRPTASCSAPRPTLGTCPARLSTSSTAFTTRAWKQPGDGPTACTCTAPRTPAARYAPWSQLPPDCGGGQSGRRSASPEPPASRTCRPAGNWAHCSPPRSPNDSPPPGDQPCLIDHQRQRPLDEVGVVREVVDVKVAAVPGGGH